MNILVISLEDYTDQGGHPQKCVPNLTALLARSKNFVNAMTTSPACSPARTAAFWGQGPWRTGIGTNQQLHTQVWPVGSGMNVIAKIKQSGWTTYGTGKIFYQNATESWNQYFRAPKPVEPLISRACREFGLNPANDFGPLPDDFPDILTDEANSEWICNKIQPGMENTLWAWGSIKPHLPFTCRQRYFDLIPENVVAPPALEFWPFDISHKDEIYGLLPQAAYDVGEKDLGPKLLQSGEHAAFVRAQLATACYADAMLGKITARLEATGQTANTIVVVIADHGWQTGHKLNFKKYTPWEQALKIPFAFAGPDIVPGTIVAPVSLVDLSPTLYDLLTITPPFEMDGQSLVDVIFNGAQPVGRAVSTWYMPPKYAIPSAPIRTVRTKDYRLVDFWDGTKVLFKHPEDKFERTNLCPGGVVPPDQASRVNHLMGFLPTLAPLLPPKNSDEG